MRRLQLLVVFLVATTIPSVAFAATVASQDFNATTSVETCGTPTIGGTITFVAWMQPDGTGEAGSGRLVEKGDGTSYAILFVTTSQALRFLADWSTTDGGWTSTTTNSTGVWTHAAVTYDDSSTTNDPTFYVNGASTGLTETATPAVTRTAESGSLRIGNNSGTTRTFDGRIAHVHVYNRILSVWEIQEIMWHPGSVTNGLILYRSLMDNSGEDLSGSGNTCTPSNTANSANGPPVFLHGSSAWMRRWFQRVQAWLVPPVWADDVVFYDPSDATVPGRVTAYERNTDPFKNGAVNHPNSLIWSLPMSSVNPWDGQVPGVAQKYWKVVSGAVVEMSQAEKDAIDAPAVAEAAEQAAFDSEITGNDWCTATLAELNTRIDNQVASLQTSLDATSTQAQTKAWIRDTMLPTIGTGFKKLAKCTRARAR